MSRKFEEINQNLGKTNDRSGSVATAYSLSAFEGRFLSSIVNKERVDRESKKPDQPEEQGP